ncbi:MAG: septation regulator SpoVG [Clostridiales bacterium]|nr:septation regulator SpoVG [Clostridiales bacterium]
MTITDIHVRKLYDNEKMKAIVSVTFDDMLVIHDIKVIQGAEKTFIAMPSKKNADGHFSDIAHPINAEMRRELEDKVLEAYREAKREAESES